MNRVILPAALALALLAPALETRVAAQSVCLPQPRLLTLSPMGGQAGSEVEVEVTGESIDSEFQLVFSDPGIRAEARPGADGKPAGNKFLVKIGQGVAPGLHEARVRTRLGLSSARVFAVGSLPETVRRVPNHTPETAFPMALNSVCNAAATPRMIDYYRFEAAAGKRVLVDCAAAGIESRLTPVLVVSDAAGNDLLMNRTSGWVDFTAPADGTYSIRVHGLTFQGGPTHYYRLAVTEVPQGQAPKRQAATRTVSSFSWTGETGLPAGAPKFAAAASPMPRPEPVRITLPCEVTGRFYPAARVDTFEFEGRKGEEWWAEVVSERLGLVTDPFLVVQKAVAENGQRKWVDVVEHNDIPAPLKPSSNGYSYDGPPYDAGSADPLGKITIAEDALYRVQIRDLFGGTKADPGNRYQLVLRRAVPDFSLAGWGLHMTLRNGDRNALSKPMTLRAGGTMAVEVVVVRKDGFAGEIQLEAEGLPEGVTAAGVRIPAGKNRGLLLLSAREDAPEGFASARLVGRATVDGRELKRPVAMGTLSWPVRDSNQEIPKPRLLGDAPVSVTRSEPAPVSILPAGGAVVQAEAGAKVSLPMTVKWRSEFSGTSLKLKATGDGMESVKELDVPLKSDRVEAVLDLAAMKVQPGEYTLAFSGPGVVKYRYNPEAVACAEREQKEAREQLAALGDAAKKLGAEASTADPEKKAALEQAVKEMSGKMKAAEAAQTEAQKKMKAAEDAAAPRDTVDIVWSEPVRLVVRAPEKK